MPKNKIELISRIIIKSHGYVLLTRKRGRTYTYLPGGHVEYGESARQAIERELDEEFGGQPQMGEFVAAVEQAFENRGKHHHEVNLVFQGTLPDYEYPQLPQSREEALEFLWQPLDELQAVNLCPVAMIELVRTSGGPAFYSAMSEG